MTILSILPVSFVLLALVICFYSVCHVCDSYLVPTVEIFIKVYRIPEEVAAVTLVAFGSAAPELILNTVSSLGGTSDISLPAILGSAMIAFGLIPSLCVLGSSQTSLSLHVFPIVREVVFYSLGLGSFLMAIEDGLMEVTEAFLCLSVYALYVGWVMAQLYFSNRTINGVSERERELGGKFLGLPGDSISRNAIVGDVNANNANNSGIIIDDGYDVSDKKSDSEDRQPLLQLEAGLSSGVTMGGSPRGGQRGGHSNALAGGMSLHPPSSPHLSSSYSSNSNNNILNNSVNSNSVNAINNNDDDKDIGSSISISISSNSSRNRLGLGNSPPENRDSIGQSGSSDAITSTTSKHNLHRGNLSPGRSLQVGNVQVVSPPCRSLELDDFDDVERVEDLQIVGCHRNFVLATQLVTKFIHNVFSVIIPTLKPGQSSVWRCTLVLIICIVIIGYLTSTIVQLCQLLVSYIGIEESTVGATLIALGSEIPDTISSVSLARKGYNDGAMAGAIGSQVINISIGVGFPALIILIKGGSDSYTIDTRQTDTLWLLTSLLFLVIASYITVTLPLRKLLCCTATSETTITRTGASFLLSMWTLAYMVFIYFNEPA